MSGNANVDSDRGKQSATQYSVCIETDAAFAPAVEAGLDLLGIVPVSWEDVERGTVRFEEFFDTEAAALGRKTEMELALREWARGEPWSVSIRTLEAQDWQETWKRFFRTEKVSGRIVVKPSWEAYDAQAGEAVIELDPGMSFGTGQHFTTRSCLRFIDRLALAFPGASVLDIGCGSGILSIAAARLGFIRVTAIDNDPDAVRIAGENLARNRVGEAVTCALGDLATFRCETAFQIVAANLLAGMLDQAAPAIARLAAAGAGTRLILSGILSRQYAGIVRRYADLGFVEEQPLTDGEWISGCFTRAD